MDATDTTPTTPNSFMKTRRYAPRSKNGQFWGPACVVALINLYAIAAMYGNDEFSRESAGKIGKMHQSHRNKHTICHMISMGGNDDWNFDLNFVNTFEGYVTHTFDCTLRDGTPGRKPDRDDIRFYNACVDKPMWSCWR